MREALGLVAEDEQLAILDLIAERRAGDVFGAIARLVDMGVDLGLFLGGFGDFVRAQLAIELGGEPGDLSERTRAARTERRGKLTAGDLLRMLSALSELEPRFRRSTQQQLLLETVLVRFALLDRTVSIEDVLREMGGAGGPASPPSERSARSSRQPTTGPARHSMGATAPRPETPASVPRVAEVVPERRDRAEPARPTPAASASVVADISPGSPVRAAARDQESRAGTVNVADLNAIAGIWDDLVSAIRRDRPVVASLLEHALPVGSSATGVLTVQVDAPNVRDGLTAKAAEVVAALGAKIVGVTRLVVRSDGDAATTIPTARMTVETVRTETLASLRRRDPVLAAAIDVLDLDLVD